MRPHRTVPLLASFACLLTVAVSGQSGPARLPGLLESYVTKVVKPTDAQRKQMLAGQPVTKLLEADPSHEVSVFGITWIKAPVDRYVAAIRDIEKFEKGENFRVTKKVSSPPRLEDFAQLTLPPDDLEDLKTCRVGSCELKLSEASLNRMRKEIDWSKPTHAVVASKMLYSTHYFWTAIELRLLVPDPSRGEGFWFARVNRSRSDGLSGFVGRLIRGKVRGEAEKGMVAALAISKSSMEGR